jgi:hypothetical protein
MSVDVRFRDDGPIPPLAPEPFFADQLPAALEAQQGLIAPGAAGLALRPLTLATPEASATLTWQDGRASVRVGPAQAGTAVWDLDADALGELAHDEKTPMAFFSAGELPLQILPAALDWWLVLRAALDARPIHTPGSVGFRDRHGGPLDLSRAFTLDDDPEEIAHFLHEAGFLHLRRVFDPRRMQQVSDDMDAAAGDYSDGDGRSWWVTTRDGQRRLVRMQGFETKSETAAGLLDDPDFRRIGEIPGDGHHNHGRPGNRCEALFKPIGVVKGISDVPWHKDCSLGRHSYDCCNLTTGISVTGAGPHSGQLRVRAGAHRALCWPALPQPGLDLPDVPLATETGDVTVHLSCTLHMAQAPALHERRVIYTGFRLPDRSPAAAEARRKIMAVREKAPVTVSQEPAGEEGRSLRN